MTEDMQQKALDAILSSRKYREICPDTVRRVFLQKCASQKRLKDAEKAARAQLHQISGAFLSPEELGRVCSLAEEYAAGRREAAQEALLLHASTRERLPSMQALYEQTFAALGGRPASVLDLACGLNPIALGAMGVPCVRGCDIQGGAVRAVDLWADAAGWNVRAECADLLCGPALPGAELALLMKLLPLLERQQAGSAVKLLETCPADALLVTFPTRTLGGRNVGMEEQYSRWMEEHLPGSLSLRERFTVGGELCYVLLRKHG